MLLSLDLRSLAAFRVLLAITVCVDLCCKGVDVGVFYSDIGVVPRADALSWFADLLYWPPALAFSSGSVIGQLLIFGMAVVAAICCAVGFRTQLAAGLTWFLLTSIQLRNPLITFGSDTLLRVLFFWGQFLPLGAVWSIDRIRRGGGDHYPRSVTVAGTIGLMVQITLVFVIAGAVKMASPAWKAGQGIALALGYDQVVRPLGVMLRQWPELCTLLSFFVMATETCGAFCLLIPAAAVRSLGIIGLALALIGFELTLRVGLFPIAGLICLVPFIPPLFWDRLGLTAGRDEVAFVSNGTRESLWAWVVSSVAGMSLVFVLVWSIGLWHQAGYRAPAPLQAFGDTLSLRQQWGMFTIDPEAGWFLVPGRLRDESTVNLFALGGPLPTIKEALGASTESSQPPVPGQSQFANMRWQIYFMHFVELPDETGPFEFYGRYLCREWNREHFGERQLVELQIVFMGRNAQSDHNAPAMVGYQRKVLWQHWCFGG